MVASWFDKANNKCESNEWIQNKELKINDKENEHENELCEKSKCGGEIQYYYYITLKDEILYIYKN